VEKPKVEEKKGSLDIKIRPSLWEVLGRKGKNPWRKQLSRMTVFFGLKLSWVLYHSG